MQKCLQRSRVIAPLAHEPRTIGTSYLPYGARILLLLLVCATCPRCSSSEPAADSHQTGTDLICPSFVLASDGLPQTGEWRSHLSVGDVNGDSLGDIAALARKDKGPRVFLSDGLGHWTEASTGLNYGGGFSCGVGTRFADVNQDGLLDLVVADHCAGVRVFHGDGGHTWKDASRGVPRNVEGVNDADVGDLDGDGLLDIVALSAFHSGFMVLQGRPNGHWAPVEGSGLPVTGSGWRVELIDVNRDSRLDVVTSFNPASSDSRSAPAPPAKVWLQSAPFQFQPATGFTEEGRWFGVATLARSDGSPPDLFFGLFGYHAGLYVYQSASGDQWTNLGRIDEPWFSERIKGFTGIEVADLNRDGCQDLVILEATRRVIWVALGDCQDRWHLCPIDTVPDSALPVQGWGLTTGDLNGDGLPDLAAAYGSRSRGSLRAWFQLKSAGAKKPAQGQGLVASKYVRGSGATAPEPKP